MPVSDRRHRGSEAIGASGRLGSLDGLRGLAALVVVVHHALLASWPALAAGYFGGTAKRWSLVWWLFDTPIHAFWAGPEAVIVFFVLSGFVLALPAVRKGERWFTVSYYPKRMARLYLPVWGALILAAGWRLAQPRVRMPGTSVWLQSHVVPMTVHGVLVQASLRDTGSWAFDPVLWSLHWEVLYSVLLPIALIPALATRRQPVAALALGAGSLALCGWGVAAGSDRFTYLPMFLLGALLAFHWSRFSCTVAAARPGTIWLAALLALCLLTSSYWVDPNWVTGSARHWIAGAVKPAAVAGAALIILLILLRPRWSGSFQRRVPRWLGSRSYSLYLVHEPIIVALAFVLRVRAPGFVFLAVAIPFSLAVTEVFWRVVERPSVRASRLAESWTSSALHRRFRFGEPRAHLPIVATATDEAM